MKALSRLFLLWVFTLMSVCAAAQNTLGNMGLTSSSPAQVAFSLRQLSASYAGSAIKVRRASDNAEATVAFDGALSPPAVSASSNVTLTAGVSLSAPLGATKTGTITTTALKAGTITIVVNKTGTITTAIGSNVVTGSGTSFSTELTVGDLLFRSSDNTFLGVVKTITNNTSLVLNNHAVLTTSGIAFKTSNAIVTGISTLFSSQLAIGERIFRSSDNAYLGTIKNISSDVSMTLDARDAVAVSSIAFIGTSATVTGSGTAFDTHLSIGDMLVSNNTTLGIVQSISSATSLTLAEKAGGAVSGAAFSATAGTIAFSSFYSGTSVFVNTWYDQSGNSRHLYQFKSGNQPRIVDAGTLKVVNSRVSIEFALSLTSFLLTTSPVNWLENTNYSINSVKAMTSYQGHDNFISTTGGSGPSNAVLHHGYRSRAAITVAQYGNDLDFVTYGTNSLELHTAIKENSATQNSGEAFFNGASLGVSINTMAKNNLIDLGLLSIGQYTPLVRYSNVNISEFAIFSQTISTTERQNMESNQLAYYSIDYARWTGNVNTEWHNTGNWSNSTLPTSSTPPVVIIPNVTNKPVISDARPAMNIIVESGSSLTIDGGTLELHGSLTGFSNNVIATNGTLEMKGTTNQTIQAETFQSNTLKNLIVNTGGSVTVSMASGSGLEVTNNLTITKNRLVLSTGHLIIGGSLTNTVRGGITGSSNSKMTVKSSVSLSFDQSTQGTTNQLRHLTINGSGAVVSLDSNLVLGSNGIFTFTDGKLDLNGNALTIRGGITNTVSGGLRGNSTSNLTIEGTTNRTISFDQTTTGTTNVLNNLSIQTTSTNTISVAGSLEIDGTLTVNSGQTLDMGTNSLGGSLATVSLSGTLSTQNTSSSPIPASKTWGGTVVYNGSSAQTLAQGTYNNLTVNNSAGLASANDVTVNGVLNLQSANPSTSKGTLDMWDGSSIKTLTMGASATTTGQGDVTGDVRRTSFVANTAYTFGNQYTTVTFPYTGTMPTDWRFRIKIGAVPSWKIGAVQRVYDIIQTDGSGMNPTVRLFYLDSELNSNTEANLVFWGRVISSSTTTEFGRINNNTSENWVSLSGPISNAATAFGQVEWTLSAKEAAKLTWIGGQSGVETDWNSNMNWTSGNVPTTYDDVLIPTGKTYYPVLPSTASVKTIEIESGASVNAGASTFTVAGGSGAWYNKGSFTKGTSTVVFTGSAATLTGETDFNNLTVNNGAGIILTTNSITRISGTLTQSGSIDAAEFINTIEYNGAAQTVVLPDAATDGYHHLILSGSGVKTMPGTSFTIYGNMSLSGTAEATAASSITLNGTLTIGNGCSFSTGNFNHLIKGDFVNNGTFTPSTDYGVQLGGASTQNISGNASFKDLSVNNAAGISISGDVTVTKTLTFTNGILSTGSNLVIIDDGASISGASDSKFINGKCRKIGNTAFTFPIGKSGVYAPISISAPSNAGDHFTAEYFNSPYSTSAPLESGLNHISKSEYWVLDRTGGTSDVSVTLSWDEDRSGAVSDISKLLVARWDGSKWVSHGNASTSGNTSAGTITSNAVGGFSPFTLGSSEEDENPLPVELIHFTASCAAGGYQLDWATATETNNDFFTVERSNNGADWIVAGSRKGSGNSSSLSTYSFADRIPHLSSSLYYRLKQTDYNGAYSYSEVISVVCFSQSAALEQLAVYPNPSTGQFFVTGFSQPLEYSVYNGLGALMQSGKITDSEPLIDLSALSNGFYTIHFTSSDAITIRKVLIY